MNSDAAKRCSKFRPCIDLHNGLVKQIVGATLSDSTPEDLKTNFVSTQVPRRVESDKKLILHPVYAHHSKSAGEFATLYRTHQVRGGHLIKLGPGNDDAAKEALKAWPDGLHIGGGITEDNCREWIEAGAEKVIVTSYLFPAGNFALERLRNISSMVGKEQLVVDVSCRKRGEKWIVAMNKWQDMTDMEVNEETLGMLSMYCSEFLIHAADVEGLCQGIDQQLIEKLGEWVKIPTTYAGGARDISDLDLVNNLSGGKVDLTFGSSLDVFGGSLVKFEDLVKYNKERCS